MKNMDGFTKKRINKILDGYIAVKVPRHVRHSVRLRYDWEPNGLVMYEERPLFYEAGWELTAIACFRSDHDTWSVLANDGHGEWIPVSCIPPDPDFESLLEQVELDREGRFWVEGEDQHEQK